MSGLVKGLSLVGLCITALIVMRLVTSNYQSATPAIQDAEDATQQVEDAMQKVEEATTQLEDIEVPSPEVPE